VRVRPVPPALTESIKKRDAVVLLELTHQDLALLDLRPAVQDKASASEHRAEKRRERRRDLFELGEDKRFFSCRAAITSAMSRSRPNLPLSSSAHAPSPSHCEG